MKFTHSKVHNVLLFIGFIRMLLCCYFLESMVLLSISHALENLLPGISPWDLSQTQWLGMKYPASIG